MDQGDGIVWALAGLILFGVPTYIIAVAAGFAINLVSWFS